MRVCWRIDAVATNFTNHRNAQAQFCNDGIRLVPIRDRRGPGATPADPIISRARRAHTVTVVRDAGKREQRVLGGTLTGITGVATQ